MRPFIARLVLAAMLMTLVMSSAQAGAQQHGKCRTHRCWHKVSVKRHLEYPQKHPERYRWRASNASWYGPGFYGHTMACGGALSTSTLGVAHKTMACGTRLVICASSCATVSVVDRGPYVAGREFDLTGATKSATGFGSTGYVRWRVLR